MILELIAGVVIGKIISTPKKNKVKCSDCKSNKYKFCVIHCPDCLKARHRTMTPGMKCKEHEKDILLFN